MGVGDRIQQLETLVRSLMQQQQQQQPGSQDKDVAVNSTSPMPSEYGNIFVPPHGTAYGNNEERATSASPAASEHGSMRLHSHGANYVSSVHWAAILDSISELNEVYETEREVAMLASSDSVPRSIPGPRLFYEPVHTTKEEILSSIPARAVVDRMVARYFNSQGVTPGTFSPKP